MEEQRIVVRMGDHETWRAEYNGHEILVVNKGRTQVEVDGTVVAVQSGKLPIATKLNLIGTIPGSDELVIVTLNGSMKNEYRGGRTEVHIYIAKELETAYGFVDPKRKFTHISDVKSAPKKPKAPRTGRIRRTRSKKSQSEQNNS